MVAAITTALDPDAFRRDPGELGDEVVHVLNGGFLDRRVLFGFVSDVKKQAEPLDT
jgi:hypothetical protein